MIVSGSHSGLFVAVEISTGNILWKRHFPDRIISSCVISLEDQFLVVGCQNGVIYVMMSKSGEVHWYFETQAMIKCTPVIDSTKG